MKKVYKVLQDVFAADPHAACNRAKKPPNGWHYEEVEEGNAYDVVVQEVVTLGEFMTLKEFFFVLVDNG